MRLNLRASGGGFLADEDGVGFSFLAIDDLNIEHYVILMRQSEDSPNSEDWGIYLEYDDQSNGAYGRVGACRLNRALISLDISAPLSESLANITEFDVKLADIPDDAYAALAEGLPRAFRGFNGLLTIE